MEFNFIDEYKYLLNQKNDIERELEHLPKGYISNKKIGNKEYKYLQYIDNGKLVSKYIKKNDIEELTNSISLRKEYEKRLPIILKRISEIEKTVEILDKKLSRDLRIIKLSIGMDKLDETQKQKCLLFSNAMVSLEGVNISDENKEDLNKWQKSNMKYMEVLEKTLKRYGFDVGV